MTENKISFPKRILESSKDFEKYVDYAEERTKSSITYILKLVSVFSIIAAICFVIELVKNNITAYNIFQNDYANYIIIFIIAYMILLILYFVSTLLDILILAFIGYISSKFIKLKIEFKKVYNIAAYSITFPMIINALYFIVNATTNFTMKYFQVMYIAIACIYTITALFIIKSDNLKQKSN